MYTLLQGHSRSCRPAPPAGRETELCGSAVAVAAVRAELYGSAVDVAAVRAAAATCGARTVPCENTHSASKAKG